MLILFGSAKLLGEIFARLGLPAIVGEILAGAVVGPHALGWIAPNDTLTALADLGVMFLLFDAGLQIRAADLLGVAGVASVVAVVEVAVTFAASWGAMAAWGAAPAASLLVSAALVATSVGVTATVLASRGLLDRRVSRIILTAAVIDDVLGLIALAAAGSVARGRVNIPEVLLTATLAAVFTMAIAKWGAPAAGRILPHFQSRARAEEAQFHIALTLMFALAALAIYAGVAAIVGAFLAGMAVSEFSGARVRDLTRGVTELLAPFFLAGIGLKLDITLFRSRSLVGLAALMLAVAVAGKLAGCVLGAIRLGWRDGLAIGLGMVPRGEVTLVVAQVGMSLALIGPDVYAGLVFVTVASALLTPFLLQRAFPPDAVEAGGNRP
jgi:Kef-type K+ transport system membrane component KefB